MFIKRNLVAIIVLTSAFRAAGINTGLALEDQVAPQYVPTAQSFSTENNNVSFNEVILAPESGSSYPELYNGFMPQ